MATKFVPSRGDDVNIVTLEFFLSTSVQVLRRPIGEEEGEDVPQRTWRWLPNTGLGQFDDLFNVDVAYRVQDMFSRLYDMDGDFSAGKFWKLR